MIKMGAALRRKSITKMEPVVSRKPFREPSSNGRTKYKEIDEPFEELKCFKRKLLTNANMSTEKSEGGFGSSRFPEDQHNNVSLAELLDSNRMRADPLNTNKQRKAISDPRSSLENQDEDIDVGVVDLDNEVDNFEDYVLGEQVQCDSSEELNKNGKKYATDLKGQLKKYEPNTLSERRMEAIYIQNQKRKLNQINQSREMTQILFEYKLRKKTLEVQSIKKIEVSKTIAALKSRTKAPEQQKIANMDFKKQICLPPIQSLEKEQSSKLKYSVSASKLGFGVKKQRTICAKEVNDVEMEGLREIEEKLRKKNIPFCSETLRKALVNVRAVPDYDIRNENPQKNLPSNYFYQRFPLGY